MIVTPFARLPRKKFDPRLEDVPRIDLDYLEEYVSDSDSESALTEESFRFSEDSDEDSNSSSFSPADDTQYSAEWSESEDESNEQDRIAEQDMLAQEEASRISALSTRKRKKPSLLKKCKNFIRRRPTYVKFQRWRKKNAEARRHAMIRRYEQMAVELGPQIREEIFAKMEEDEK